MHRLSKRRAEDTLVKEILEDLGLSKYHKTFKKEEVDYEAFILLEDRDLERMGIAMGPRRKILHRIVEETNKSGAGEDGNPDTVHCGGDEEVEQQQQHAPAEDGVDDVPRREAVNHPDDEDKAGARADKDCSMLTSVPPSTPKMEYHLLRVDTSNLPQGQHHFATAMVKVEDVCSVASILSLLLRKLKLHDTGMYQVDDLCLVDKEAMDRVVGDGSDGDVIVGSLSKNSLMLCTKSFWASSKGKSGFCGSTGDSSAKSTSMVVGESIREKKGQQAYDELPRVSASLITRPARTFTIAEEDDFYGPTSLEISSLADVSLPQPPSIIKEPGEAMRPREDEEEAEERIRRATIVKKAELMNLKNFSLPQTRLSLDDDEVVVDDAAEHI